MIIWYMKTWYSLKPLWILSIFPVWFLCHKCPNAPKPKMYLREQNPLISFSLKLPKREKCLNTNTTHFPNLIGICFSVMPHCSFVWRRIKIIKINLAYINWWWQYVCKGIWTPDSFTRFVWEVKIKSATWTVFRNMGWFISRLM